MTGWRAALRIAWREARKSRGRTTLVVALILVPVAALSFAAVTYDSYELTPDEDASRRMGTAQALLGWPHTGPVIQEPDQTFAIPTGADEGRQRSEERLRTLVGAELLPVQQTGVNLRTAAGVGRANVQMLDLNNPLTTGMFTVREGRVPTSGAEVALSRKAMDRTGATVGGSVTTDDGKTFTVVGVIEEPGRLDVTTLVTVPGTFPGADTSWLTTTPLSWTKVKELNKLGISVLSREVLHNLPTAADRYPQLGDANELQGEVLALIAGLAVLEMALLAGAALAVGTRRRKRDLALVAAVGGSPAHVRRIVLADGVVLGTLAAVGGVVLGAGAAALGRPVVEWAVEERFGAQRFFPSALAALAVLAVVTGVLAALVPAWISSRQDVVTALAGRRGVVRSRRRWRLLGLVLVAAGVATGIFGALEMVTPAILIALILTEVGLVLCTPSLLGALAKTGRWLPVALRIALRDASRNRTAAAPAISAVMAAVIGTIAVSVVLTSQEEQESKQLAGNLGDVSVYRLDDIGKARTASMPPAVTAAMRANLPLAETHEIKLLSCDGGACFAHIRPPAERECPYVPDVLGHEPTDAEQRAARADQRCDGVGRSRQYFGAFGSPNGFVAVVSPDAARTLLDLRPEEVAAVTAALTEGKIVVDDPTLLKDNQVLLATGMQSRTTPAPGHVTPRRAKAPLALMTEDAARKLGFEVSTFTQYATTTRMPTEGEQEALTAALGGEYEVQVDRPAETDVERALTVLALVAGLITLAAAALATGLAAAEGRRDLTTLAAVGATPGLRKTLSLSQAGVIAGLGGFLGTAAGVGSALALLAALNVGYGQVWPEPPPNPLTIPWPNVAVALVVVPATAMLGAALFTRSRLPIERRE